MEMATATPQIPYHIEPMTIEQAVEIGLELKAETKPPVIISYGMGLDSTAMLIEMHNRGWAAPDAIVFSDTGGEKPETYAYLDIINGWLRSVGWPEVTVVRYVPTRAPSTNLEGKCEANETLRHHVRL